jgi:hypothetical protein
LARIAVEPGPRRGIWLASTLIGCPVIGQLTDPRQRRVDLVVLAQFE